MRRLAAGIAALLGASWGVGDAPLKAQQAAAMVPADGFSWSGTLSQGGLIVGTAAVIRNNPGGTTVNISRTVAPTSVVTTTERTTDVTTERTTDVTTERTTETSREVIAPTTPTIAPPTIPTREPNTPTTTPAAAGNQATETVATS